MENGAYWILLLPIIILLVLYYLGFLTVGLAFIKSAFSGGGSRPRLFLLLIGVAVLMAPFAISRYKDLKAQEQTDQRQAYLANLPRIDMTGRMPRKFVTVGSFSPSDIKFIQSRYGMTPFPEAEHERLRTAYRQYRGTEYCHSHSSGKMRSAKIQIPVCRDLPESLQSVLQLSEPVLFIAEGSSTSHRQSNTYIGDMYEIRWVTPYEDRLVDYYEQRMVPSPPGITNPLSSGWKRDPKDPGMTPQAFISAALDRKGKT